jgi:hypothetical protein
MATCVLSSESTEVDDVATAVLLDIGAELAALVGVSNRVRERVGRSSASSAISAS